MSNPLNPLAKEAIDLLHKLTTPHGILASTIATDNYKRIWARDSIVCGMAGVWLNDSQLIDGLKDSLLTLAKHQHELGMIPSNVLPSANEVSFGSLMGRVDSNTWFILGSCSYYQHTQDEITWKVLKSAVEKCRSFLQTVEYNNKGLIYTPLSGNWADEYPIHGHTLYDNMLRLWGEKLWVEITGGNPENLRSLESKLFTNFWPSEDASEKEMYHKDAFKRLDFGSIQHFLAFILPGNFDARFDAAGNAIALLQTQLSSFQKSKLSKYIQTLASETSNPLIPAFWPIITEESSDWNLLKGNYSFEFKNYAGAFHNGGIWPVWMGLFCLGLAKNGMMEEVELITTAFSEVIAKSPDWDFQEYVHAKTLAVGGKTKMGYTASGIVFMKLALDKINL